VCVELGNWGLPNAVPVLSRALFDPGPLVRAHAAWALGSVGSAEVRSAFVGPAAVEPDPSVLEELSVAMDAGPSSAKNPGSLRAVRSTTAADARLPMVTFDVRQAQAARLLGWRSRCALAG
jgi:HEAT repeat protein